MAIEDFQSGYRLLELALRHVQRNDEDLTVDEKAYISELWAVSQHVRYQSEHAREIYDAIMRPKTPRERFFNFDNNGEITEVTKEEYAGDLTEEANDEYQA